VVPDRRHGDRWPPCARPGRNSATRASCCSS
jgi:hypothetical protein